MANLYFSSPADLESAQDKKLFRKLFMKWATRVNSGEDLEAAAKAEGGDVLWDAIWLMTHPAFLRNDLREHLSRGHVVFHVRSSDGKTVWFST